ncbi:phosphate-starvation-inducible PsiE family protein [Magnetospirillum molischianum]|uniref:Phosphate-starvation-inducible E n=1 Tax=Magnetospirillum molischianum DSM 120 TaxID=1150626 RepID=H8FR81_MAGML|nr:phosphate-starvation-inducible PsiE family protein [Magnetospirillum molischianum]CCG40869.1 conserved hypothetical protein [Magnetospirillum molischianum DSM 120]
MSESDHSDKEISRISQIATRGFLKIEVFAYIVLGGMIALTALIGIGNAGASLWGAVHDIGSTEKIIVTIDRLLFVLMLVEILHTVRDSFRTGTLVCEPFLIVGLIASIRRVLSITLQSSQANHPGSWSPESQAILHSTMLELGVLGGLIMVMVISICLLRFNKQRASEK